MGGTVMNGFITNWSAHYKFGQIEIESPDLDKRYRRVYFKLDDAVMPSGNFDLDKIFIRDGTKGRFEFDSIDYDVEFQDVNRRKIYDGKAEDGVDEVEGVNFHFEDVEPNVHIKAINLVSEGLDFLEMSENTSYSGISAMDSTDLNTNTTSNTQKTFKLDLNEDNATKMNDDDDEDDQPLSADDDEEEVEALK